MSRRKLRLGRHEHEVASTMLTIGMTNDELLQVYVIAGIFWTDLRNDAQRWRSVRDAADAKAWKSVCTRARVAILRRMSKGKMECS